MSLETWNTLDNLPQLSAGQKVVVSYTEDASSKLLLDICIDYYGVNNTIILCLVGFNEMFSNNDELPVRYEDLINNAYNELEKYHCQKIFINKSSLPPARKSSSNFNLYLLEVQALSKHTGRSFQQLADEIVVVAPHLRDMYYMWELRHAASEKGITVAEYLRSNPDHVVNKLLISGDVTQEQINIADGSPRVDIASFPDLGDGYGPNRFYSMLYFPFKDLTSADLNQLAQKMGYD
jgi:hypothetical protein